MFRLPLRGDTSHAYGPLAYLKMLEDPASVLTVDPRVKISSERLAPIAVNRIFSPWP